MKLFKIIWNAAHTVKGSTVSNNTKNKFFLAGREMLLLLNDDCILHICKFLDYSEHSSLAHTCQRLQTIIEDNWTHGYKKVNLDCEQCLWFNERRNYFIEFMSCICENVEKLELQSIESKTFQLLQNLLFPKTISFLINLGYSDECSDDENTKLISKLFPKLTKLSLACSFATGNYLWNLRNLLELEIGGCEGLKTKYFKKIFSTLRLKKLQIMFYGYNTCFDELGADIAECKTLEEIFIDDHHLLLLIEQLPTLKKLKKLVVYTRDYDTYLLEKIVERYGNCMHTMIFDDVFWSHNDHCENIVRMQNLRRFLMHDDDIEGEQLKLIGKSLRKTLQEFRYIKGRRSNNIEEGLIEFLNDCKNLEIFDISESKEFDVQFLRKVIDKLSADFKSRKKPLIFRCFDTNITKEDAELLTIPNCIEVTLAKENVRFPGGRCFECEWKLPEESSLD